MADMGRAQGLLLGRLADIGMAPRDQPSSPALPDDAVKTSEIESDQLNVNRSGHPSPAVWASTSVL